MRSLAVLSLVLLAAPAPEIWYFHFERPIETPSQTGGQTCLVVDPAVFAHAAPQLADLRVYQGSSETPFVVRSDVPVVSTDQAIGLLNLGKSGNQTVFDAEMPRGKYSDLQLKVNGHDFLATVTVSGGQSQTAGSRTKLGSFTISISRGNGWAAARYCTCRNRISGICISRLPDRSRPKTSRGFL